MKEKIKGILKSILKDPDEVDESIKGWFDENKKISLLVALIAGFLTHLIILSNTLLSQDGLWNSLDYSVPGEWEFALGRWGIYYAGKIVNYLAIPAITSVVSIMLLVVATILVIDLFKLKNKITIFIVSTIFVISPACAGTLLYSYTAVAYSISMLLSVITVALIFKNKGKAFNLCLATILFAFSIGIYQSYIGVVIGLSVLRIIKDLYDDEITIKKTIINGLSVIGVVLVGGILYAIITEILLKVKGISEATYKGMENIGLVNTITQLPNSIVKVYTDFWNYYFTDKILANTPFARQRLYKIFFASIAILEVILIIDKKMYKKIARLALIILLNAILPIAFGVVTLVATENVTYLLTSIQYMLILAMGAYLIEIAGKKYTFLFKWLALFTMFGVIFTYYLSINASYMSLKYKYDQSVASVNRMIDRMEQTEGYKPENPYMVVGVFNPRLTSAYVLPNKYEHYSLGDIFFYPVYHGSVSGMMGTWNKFIWNYAGQNLHFCSEEDYMRILGTDEFKNMPVFPSDGSVKVIDDITVVKLTSDEKQIPGLMD